VDADPPGLLASGQQDPAGFGTSLDLYMILELEFEDLNAADYLLHDP